MEITRIKVNGMEYPMGMNYDVLLVSWNVINAKGSHQKNVEIQVASDEKMKQIVYETAGAELDCSGVELQVSLQPRTRYYIRINVVDETGDSAAGMTWFETGKREEAWEAEWIGQQDVDSFHPVFRKCFSLAKAELDQVQKSRLYICGLGVYEAYLNGEKVGDEYLAPFLNDYRFALQVQTYDVTGLLKEENELQVFLGNGWYKGRFGQVNKTYGDRFALIAELYTDDPEKSICRIKTDETWEYKGSDIEESGIYDGEVFNRLLWNNRENEWKRAGKLDLDRSLLTDRFSVPVREKETVSVKEVITTASGDTVLDMGQNFTGWISFLNTQPAGAEISLEFGEVLQEGEFYNENYRSATGGFRYRSAGNREWVRPHFTFFGFRYVRVRGWNGKINPDDFQGKVIYSDLERTGYLKTNHSGLNRLIENCMWGQKSNFLDMPTDCPQRDERLGWTADAQVFSATATYNMDTRAFYRKYLWDMRQIQKVMNGAVPGYLPQAEGMCPVCSVWGDAATIIPDTMWQFYGNKTELAEQYPLMKDWVDYIAGEMQNRYGKRSGIWDFTFHFGDWLALDGVNEQAMKGGTDDGYLATMYYYNSAVLVAKAAGELGHLEEEVYYQNLAEEIRACLLREYFTPAGHLSVDTQAAYVVALRFGVYNDKSVLIRDFLKRLEKDEYKIKCGFVGAPVLCQTLSACGHSELAYRLLLQEGFPGWLYEVNLGATTIWERWNSLLPDGKISGTNMNSLNHYSYGSVIEFLYAYSAGLRPQKSGFKEVMIAPQPDGRLRWTECTYLSPDGKYVVNWKLTDNGDVEIHIEIPFACKASVLLPGSGREAFDLETGTYDYRYTPVCDYRRKYTEDTSLSEVFADEQAKAILFECIPHAEMLDNPIDASIPLKQLRERGFIGITNEMAEKTIQRLAELKRWGNDD